MTDRWIAYMPLDEIRRAARNPKGHDATLIRSSVDRLGFIEPIVMDERTERLVAGHGRLDDLEARQAAGDADLPDGIQIGDDGRWLAPVSRGWASKNDADAERAVIVLNRATEAGGWSNDVLSAMLADLRSSTDGLDATGYDEDALETMLADLAPPDFRPDPTVPPRLDSRNPIVCPSCGHHFFRS